MSAFTDLAARLQKGTPRLLDKRVVAKNTRIIDQAERAKCQVRSGGRCEVLEVSEYVVMGIPILKTATNRCLRGASQNHHLIGGSGRRNKGKSILAEHRLDVCATGAIKNYTRRFLYQ